MLSIAQKFQARKKMLFKNLCYMVRFVKLIWYWNTDEKKGGNILAIDKTGQLYTERKGLLL